MVGVSNGDCWLSASLPQQEGLATEALQTVKPPEEDDSLLVAFHKGSRLQESRAVVRVADAEAIGKADEAESMLPGSCCASL